MAKILDLPKLSPTMEEGTLVRWFRHVGDTVAIDDLLAEVETDKATMEFRAFDKGTLLALLVPEGAVARLGQPVAVMGAPGEDVTEILASVRKTVPPTVGAPVPIEPVKMSPRADAETATPEAKPVQAEAPAAEEHGSTGIAGAMLMPTTPRVRRIAREMVLDLGGVTGTGEHGRVVEEDIHGKIPGKPTVTPGTGTGTGTVLGGYGERGADTVRTPSATRRTIARRITEAKQSVPHFYLEADLDVEALGRLRESLNEGVPAEERVSFNDLFIKASALALREVPASNVSWVDGNIVEHHRVDISMAVAIEDGLVTPVLRDVDALSIRVVAARARELIARARARKLTPEEMSNGVFSVSNLGMYQVDRFTAVINPPEGMILAVGAVRDIPVLRDGAVVAGRCCTVTLSCDHRVVDGALGASFLKALRGLIERPLRVV